MSPRQHSNASLALKPVDVNAQFDTAAAISACEQAGLSGEAIDVATQRYYTGERFLDLITFLGCSPNIALQAEPGKDTFTHIIFHQHEQPVLFHGQHTRPPHCPHCGKPERDWREKIEQPEWLCTHCQQVAKPVQYQWRKTAGVACTLIEITDIYPKEVIPQPALLSMLQQHTGVEWDYFYF